MFDPNIVSQLAYSVPVLLVVFGYLILRERKLREAEEARDARHRELVEAQQTVVKLVADQHERATERIAGTFNAIVERHEAIEKEDRAAQREMSKSVVSALVESANAKHAMAGALRDLSRQLHKSDDSFSLLSQEVHAMSAHQTDDGPHLGVPGGQFEPDTTYSAAYLQQQSDSLPWTHKAFGVDALHARNVRGKGATVVVVDTGIDGGHPDLKANLNMAFSRDFTGQGVFDGNGHGTHCSGIVCADNQGFGTLGVAPDSTVINCKGLSNQGSGRGDQLANGIRYAADIPGHKVFSLSFGSSGEDRQISAAIRYAISKGHWVFAAAGNEGPGSINWPGALPEVVCVASTDPNGKASSFSSGNDQVDVGWGGSKILSTIPGNRYAEYSGTSMATPGVAGVAALAVGELIKVGGRIPTQAEMMAVLFETCSDPAGRNSSVGYGLVQPAQFIAAMLAKFGPAQPVDPTPPPADAVRIAVPPGAKFVEVRFATA
jgi:subtilisin family serine protease